MKRPFTAPGLVLLCVFWWTANGQQEMSSVRIRSVKARNNQKDSLTIPVHLAQKAILELPYDKNYLLFDFVNTQDSAQQSFAYKLLGLDYAWITCTQCSQVQYAHLDGGAYTFLVKTTQPNAIPTEFKFVVEETMWHRWWFAPLLFLYFLAIIGVSIYLFILFQFRQKLRQQRLIHTARMASMAELTAGIAHEIQNPLNFVNNFSELSVELAQELTEELETPAFDKELVSELTHDLLQNQQKIYQHGQRASSIVKSMLDHSRNTTGERQLTDLNKLADEYIRLAYHGFRRSEGRPPGDPAKDKNFQAEYVTDFDPTLPLVHVVPQEMGRVLLNLMNNAFYAVTEHARQSNTAYRPVVTVLTKKLETKIEIKVKDNGVGIPEAIRAKIFQPFFTTKPTGEGTGLGLSLAYDIITKGHSGTLEVESREGEGTEFTIRLRAT